MVSMKKDITKNLRNIYTHNKYITYQYLQKLLIKINMKTCSNKINRLIKNNSFGHTGKKNKQIREIK